MLGLAAGSLAFLADLQEDWIAHGKKVFPVLREKHPQAYFGGLVALAKMIRWETAEELLSDGGMTPEEIMEKLEERVGPQGRKLFEDFLRKVNKLQAQQQLEAQARTVENRGGDRGRYHSRALTRLLVDDSSAPGPRCAADIEVTVGWDQALVSGSLQSFLDTADKVVLTEWLV